MPQPLFGKEVIGRETLSKKSKQDPPCVIISEKWQKTNKLRKVGERSKLLMRSLRTHSKLQGNGGGTQGTAREEAAAEGGGAEGEQEEELGDGRLFNSTSASGWCWLGREAGKNVLQLWKSLFKHHAPSRTADSSFQLPMALCSHLWVPLASEPN